MWPYSRVLTGQVLEAHSAPQQSYLQSTQPISGEETATGDGCDCKHDPMIGNQFAQAQFKVVKKNFQGPQALQSRLLTTFGRVIQLSLQGQPLGISEVLDHTLSAFYDLTTSMPTSMAFLGPLLNVMGTTPANYQNFRATSRSNSHFPGYAQYMARTHNGPCVNHFARLRSSSHIDQALSL